MEVGETFVKPLEAHLNHRPADGNGGNGAKTRLAPKEHADDHHDNVQNDAHLAHLPAVFIHKGEGEGFISAPAKGGEGLHCRAETHDDNAQQHQKEAQHPALGIHQDGSEVVDKDPCEDQHDHRADVHLPAVIENAEKENGGVDDPAGLPHGDGKGVSNTVQHGGEGGGAEACPDGQHKAENRDGTAQCNDQAFLYIGFCSLHKVGFTPFAVFSPQYTAFFTLVQGRGKILPFAGDVL